MTKENCAIAQENYTAEIIEFDAVAATAFDRLRKAKDPYQTQKARSARDDAQAGLPREYAVQAATALKSTGKAFPNHNVLTLAHALAYADAGLYVVDAHALDYRGKGTGPGGQSKLPRGPKWQERATTDPETIKSFWTGKGRYAEDAHGESRPFPPANAPRNVSIAFPENCGLFVLDIDGEAGKAALAALEKQHGMLPETWTSITGSGGWHIILRAPGLDIRNTASSIAPGVDIRGKNGQIVAPPSIHPSGKFYRWLEESAPWDCEVADAPDWLVKLAFEATKGRGADKGQVGSKGGTSKASGKVGTARVSAGRGFEGHLASIGDGGDFLGFNAPIYSAACAYFGAGQDDVAALKAALLEAILAAPCNNDRAVTRYATDGYLDERIEQARVFIAAQTTPPDARSTGLPRKIADPLFDASLTDGGWVKGEGDALQKNARKIKAQMRASMAEMFSFVIVEGGEARAFLHPSRGEAPRIWKDTALSKTFKNRRVAWMPDKAVEHIDPASEFLTDPMRPTFIGTQFEPDPARANPDLFNLWSGLKAEPIEGDWGLLRGHVFDQMIKGNGATAKEDARLFAWLMTWLADLVQHPGCKAGSAVAFLGEQGAGKSKLGDWLRQAIGAAAVKISQRKHLVGAFNAHLDAKILVVAEEAFWSGDKEAAGTLKDHISGDTMTVERKGVDAATRANYIRFIFISNESWVIPTDDNADARRFFVARVNNNKKQDAKFFAAIDTQMKSGGLEAMMFELMTWNPEDHGLTWADLRIPPWTAAKGEQATYGLSGPRAALKAVIDAGILSGMAKDGTSFAYDLSDDDMTPVLKEHLVAAIGGRDVHGGAGKAIGSAISGLLGDDADQGDSKRQIEYLDPRKVDVMESEGLRSKKGRWVAVPPLGGLRVHLATIYT